jgi:hypothetical protein
MMPRTAPPLEEEEDNVNRSRITQLAMHMLARARTHGGAQPTRTGPGRAAEADGGNELGAHTRGSGP